MRELEYPFDSSFILRKRKSIKKKLLQERSQWIDIRIAVLGGSTTTDIVAVLELFLLNSGIRPAFYESEYGRYWEDAVFGNKELDNFCPEIVFLHTSIRNIFYFPSVQDTEQEVDEKLKKEYGHLEKAWHALQSRYRCMIIQNNFERPRLGTFGNQDVSDYRGWGYFVGRLNQLLYRYKHDNKNFYIHDVEGLSSEYGLRKWQDLRFWYLYKYCLNIEAIPEFAYHLGSIIKSVYGKNKRVLVLDADDTLWAGVIGECGADGIDIGTETSKGQSFREWQAYLKRMRQQGVLLAIASKNQAESVKAGLKHPDSILSAEDFSAMRVNWEDKASNLRQLAMELNLDLSQMVFIDDSPAERDSVRQMLPEVEVADADCPEAYIGYLTNAHLFEVTELTEEDMSRSEMYAANLNREKEKENFADYEEYLTSLDMKAEIGVFKPTDYGRLTQLINKTNQFNLTARRFTQEEVAKLAEDKHWICISGRLTDRFGDNGIVSALMAERAGGSLHIRLMLLSCRVFKRGMEYAMLDYLADYCLAHDIVKIVGYYYPTPKNRLAGSFYQCAGFQMAATHEGGGSVWELEAAGYKKHNNAIQMKGDYCGQRTNIE